MAWRRCTVKIWCRHSNAKERNETRALWSYFVFFSCAKGEVKILDASAKEEKKTRRRTHEIHRTSKAKNNEANREYRSPVCEHKDVIYKTEEHIVRQSNYRCKEHEQKRETERVYYTNIKGVSRRAGFYYLRRAAQILAFSTIYCMQ